jgi:hypothetical protein
MKNSGLVIGGAVVVIAAIIIGAVVTHKGNDSSSWSNPKGRTSSTQTSTMYKAVAACKAFTLSDATAILGQGTKAGSNNGSSDTASDDVAVSTCSYSGASGITVEDTKTITVLARAAKTKAGADSNESVFGANKPAGKQDVSGVGDAAFWDAQLSQLDILQHHNWYIIGNMSGTHADSGTVEVSKAVYDQIKNKL